MDAFSWHSAPALVQPTHQHLVVACQVGDEGEASVNRTLVWSVGAGAIAASTVVAMVGMAVADADGQKTSRNHVPTLGGAEQYQHIALPTIEPPDGALVQVYSSADPVVDGEQIAFQYDGYTISLCTRSAARSDPTACDPQPGEEAGVARRYADGEYVTTIRAYGKGLASPTGTPAEATALFTNADLTSSPAWLAAYAKRNNERIAG